MTVTEQLRTALSDRYAIERLIGEGGMATVYLARDLRHNRRVALKVLRADLGAVLGVDRFLAEIQVTANLQHPNLLPLFDSGQVREAHPERSEGPSLLYYVMPYVEGESLRARLDREQQLPIEDALRIATAVANALDYAHAHGVIHRDLKPENILLQHGQPVVADFGIALAVSNAGGTRITQTGLSLGTPQYMSPEQATGDRVIDGRTDIYSLAAVTYEMLAGEPPHTGTSAQAIIAKLMTTTPQPVRVLRPSVPAHVAMAVERGLAKLPADRFSSARAFADALGNASFATSGVVPVMSPAAARTHPRLVMALGAVAAVSMIAATWGWLRPAPPQPVLRYELALDSTSQLVRTGRWGRIALSPDGSMLAYIGGPQNAVMLRRRNQLDAGMLPGTEQSGGAVFSPDGKRIAFIQNAGLLAIASVDGTPPFGVSDSLVGLAGIAWAGNDTLLVDGRGPTPLLRIAARAGSRPEALTTLDSTLNELDQMLPEVLPGGAVLYTMLRSGAPPAVAVLDPRSGARRVLVEGALRPRYASGRLLYVTIDGVLMAVGFNPRNQEVSGTPVVVAAGLPTVLSAVDVAVSQAGTLAYVASPEGTADRELIWASRNGSVTVADSTWRAPFTDPAISPDGTRLAVSDGSVVGSIEHSNVWIKPLMSGGRMRVSAERSRNRFPVWTRDGRFLLYVSTDTVTAIIENPADGSVAPTRRVVTSEIIGALTATPDGEWIVYQQGSAGRTKLYAHRRGDSVSTPVLAGEGRQLGPALSPDGRYLAFMLVEGPMPLVYVAPFPNPGNVKWLVSPRWGVDPVWANNGKELFYRDPIASTLVSVPVNTGSSLTFGAPRSLFPVPGVARFAVSHDDTRFLMVRPVGATLAARNHLIVVENWVRGLEAAGVR
ncbi:MAG TPA: protein kinase [Gemmatimonadaceae bacterium]